MAAAGVGAWWLLAPGSTSLAHDGARTTAPSTVSAASAKAEQGGGAPGGAATRAPYSTAGQLVHAEKQKLWQARYEQAEQVYASYRDATRYPHESRPLSEHPDQIHPFDPVSEETSLRNANGEPIKGVRLRTTQDRVFLSASDTVRFSIEALDDQGQRLPVLVRSAAAQSVPDTRTPVPLIQTDVAFGDNGTGADLQAGDGTYTALLNPALQGFGNYDGTIRVLAQVAAKGQQGVAHFDVVYAPGVPASWAGVPTKLKSSSSVV